MSLLVPTTAGWDTAIANRENARYYKVLIDTNDDQVLDDVTSDLRNNSVVGGERAGQAGAQYTVVLRNNSGTYTEGDFAGAICAIQAQVSGEGYITIFTGFVSDKGAERHRTKLSDDTVTFRFFDRVKHKGTKRKTDKAIWSNYTISDTGTPESSIFHKLADIMGLASGDVDIDDITLTKDFVRLSGNTTAWAELQKLAAQYLARPMCFRYDGKLRFISRHSDSWEELASEWTFEEGVNIHSYDRKAKGSSATRAHTTFELFEQVGEAGRIAYFNTQGYNESTGKISIAVAAGEYWPGPNAGDKARLNYGDSKTGEAYPLGLSIQTPTIGATGSGKDIESDGGGAMTIVSFDGSTAATQKNAESSEIILQNDTAGTITITKLQLRGTVYRISEQYKVQDIDAGTAEEDHVDKMIPGDYAVSVAQAHITTEWETQFGADSDRIETDLIADWLPNIQKGAAVSLVIASESISETCIVESYTHLDPKGPMGKAKTKVKLIAEESFVPTETPEVTIAHPSPPVPPGDGVSPGDGSTTPEIPLGLNAQAVGTDIVISVLPQTIANGYTKTLTNFLAWELQVSDDNATWYSLEFDGSDWKDILDAYTVLYSPSLVHSNIPTINEPPEGKLLYYRIRATTETDGARDQVSSYSASVNDTTEPHASATETIPPVNGAITNLAGNTYANVTITFTVGDDTHGGTYGAGEYSGLAGHRLWRRLNGTATETQVVGDTGNPTDTTFVDITAIDNVAYDYGISAYDINGNESSIAWYGTPITPQYTAVPGNVATISAIAYPDRILLLWDTVGGPVGPYIYDVERDVGAGYVSLLTDHETTQYEDSVAEGTEYSALSGYKYRVKAQDKYENLSELWAEVIGPARHMTFGTWAPETVGAGAIHASGDKRSISVTIDAMGEDTPADFTDDLIWADGISIQISINNSNWYAPNFEASGSEDVNRWYTGSENDFTDISELSFVLQNMPLTNEDSPPVSAETYYLRFRYKRKSESAQVYSAAWSSSISVVCTATGAKDIVENAIHQATIDMSDWLILREGPAAYYSLNDVGLDQVDFQFKDNSGNGNHGTANELLATDSEAGPAGPCPVFDGDSTVITTGYTAEPTAGSISLWFKTDASGVLVSKNEDGNNRFYFAVDIGAYPDDSIGCFFAVGGTKLAMYVRNGAETYKDDLWHHAVIVIDGVNNTIYIDGVEQTITFQTGSAQTSGYFLNMTAALLIGFYSTTYFDGEIAHVRVFDVGLGQGAVRWLYENPSGNIPEMFLAHRIAVGSIYAEHLSVLGRGSLVNNPTESLHLGGWGHHWENGELMSGESTALTTPDVTYQAQTVKAMRLSDDNQYGVRSKSFPVSQNKIYKISVTMKSSTTDGDVYIGPIGESTPFDADEGDSLNFAGSLNFAEYYGDDYAVNPRVLVRTVPGAYFLATAIPSTSWQTFTMYIIGMDRSIDECQKSEGPNSIVNRTLIQMADSRITHVGIKFLIWGATGARTDDYINWSVTEVGSGTVVADNISVANLAAIKANLGVLSDGGKIGADANNYWNLDTGVFRVGDTTNYMYYDGAGSLSLRLTTFKVTTDLTRVKGTVEISNEGDIDTGLTDPLQLYADTASPNKEHTINASASSLKLHLALGGTDILTLYNDKVGIGTTAPASELDVRTNTTDTTFTAQVRQEGTGDATYVARVPAGGWQWGVDNSNADSFNIAPNLTDVGSSPSLTILTGGNVAIGSAAALVDATAGYVLQLKQDTAGQVYIHFSNNTTGHTDSDGVQFGLVGGATVHFECWNKENGFMRFATNNTERMRIAAGGNVGINDTTPSYKLDVNGTFRATGAVTLDSTLAVTGDMGIGRTPTTDLDLYRASGNVEFLIETGADEDSYIEFKTSVYSMSMGIDASMADRVWKISPSAGVGVGGFWVNRDSSIGTEWGRFYFKHDGDNPLTNADVFIHFASDAFLQWDESEDYWIFDTKGVKIGGGIREPNYIHSSVNSESTNFDLLSPFIPNTGDEMMVTGEGQAETPPWEPNPVFGVSRAVRTSTTVITLYGYDSNNNTLVAVPIQEGDSDQWQGLSIAW